jgi:transcription elongation factor Elf1
LVAVSERQVRLLYKTTCWTCGAPIAAGTTTWWDDERGHATCTRCVRDTRARVDDTSTTSLTLDRRTRRRLEIMRAHRPRVSTR